jgi:hypothetical protein
MKPQFTGTAADPVAVPLAGPESNGWMVVDVDKQAHKFPSRDAARDYARKAKLAAPIPKGKHDTREEWLAAAIEELKPILEEAGAPAFLTPLVSIGIPSSRGMASKKQSIGECWPDKTTEAGRCTIFISPFLDPNTETLKILGVLLHELCHAAVGCKAGHGTAFSRIMQIMGFVKPWTVANTPPEGSELEAKLKKIADKLGPFPHHKLKLTDRPTEKAETRMKKFVCNKCSQVIRAAGMVGKMKCIETYREQGNPKKYLEKPRPCGGIYVEDTKGKAKPKPPAETF